MSSLLRRPWVLVSNGFKDLQNPPRGNRPSLDVLRSLAVSLVLVYHLQGSFPHAALTLKSPFVRFGWSGVDLFCVLSGLLIGGQLWKELKSKGTIDVTRFILRRGFRIWPLYYALVAFLFAQQIFLRIARPGLWMDATFLSNYFAYFPVGRHQVAGGWSLSLEEQFYLLIPILLVLGAKLISPRTLLGLAVVWFLALPVIRHFVLQGVAGAAARSDAVYYPFHTHSDSLAIGLMIAWIITWKSEFLRKNLWVDLALIATFLIGFGFWYRAPLTFLYSIVALSYGALTFLLLRAGLPAKFPSRIFYVISRLSFGVYLIHPGLLKHVMPLHNRLFGESFRGFFLAFFLWGAVCLGIAFLTFSFIELPFLQLRDRLLAKNRVADSGLAALPGARTTG